MADSVSTIRLIAGLGNPGPEYQHTRHNAGFWFVDALAAKYGASLRRESRFHGEVARTAIEGHECWLLKPDTFMNRSGQSVAALAGFYKIPVEQVLVVHDELDLDPGVARFKQGGGHGGHNGLRDLDLRLGGKLFYRLRLGIGHPGHRDLVTDYVLGKPSATDRELIITTMDAALDVLPLFIAGEHGRAMNQLHRDRQQQ